MLSCSHAAKPVSISLQQKSLFAVLLSLISSDCQPIHKAPASTWGAVLLNAPPGLHSHFGGIEGAP